MPAGISDIQKPIFYKQYYENQVMLREGHIEWDGKRRKLRR
jgi:hypothetical protein